MSRTKDNLTLFPEHLCIVHLSTICILFRALVCILDHLKWCKQVPDEHKTELIQKIALTTIFKHLI